MTMTIINFFECEHDGDMERYREDLIESGAKIIRSDSNFNEESCGVVIEVKDISEFKQKFALTDSYGFSHIRR